MNIRELRSNLAQHIKRVQEGERLQILSHSTPVAGLVSVRDLYRLSALQEEPRMKIYTFFNHAGGSSKTTLTRDIAYSLVQMGYRVLAVDLDSQANLSEWLGIPYEEIHTEDTALKTILHDAPLQVKWSKHGIDIIPANLELIDADELLSTSVLNFRTALRSFAKAHQYDFVLIDASPSPGVLSQQACIAADAIISPVIANSKGFSSLITLERVLNRVRKLNPELHVLLYVITQIESRSRERRKSHDVITQFLAEKGLPFYDGLTKRETVYELAALETLPVPGLKERVHGLNDAKAEIAEIVGAILQLSGVAVES